MNDEREYLSGNLHVFRKRVDFGDVDHAGILYYPKMFHYAHLAYEDWLRSIPGWSLPDFFQSHRLGTPVVQTSASFEGPLAHGERVHIEMKVTRLGERSFSLEFGLFDEESMTRRATVRVTHAMVSMETFQAVAIPEPLRAQMASSLSGREEVDG